MSDRLIDPETDDPDKLIRWQARLIIMLEANLIKAHAGQGDPSTKRLVESITENPFKMKSVMHHEYTMKSWRLSTGCFNQFGPSTIFRYGLKRWHTTDDELRTTGPTSIYPDGRKVWHTKKDQGGRTQKAL